MASEDQRRSSRIPRPVGPPGGRALAERSLNNNGGGGGGGGGAGAFDRKRRLDAVPEPSSKRQAAGSSAGSAEARPARSAPAPASSNAAQPASSFLSEGNKDKAPATGPAPGEESFDDIHARTGQSEEDILGKKMAFRKGLKPEKKIDEMVPMIKELRAVGWHLLSGRSKATMDADQWKAHCEEVEASYSHDKAEWAKKQDAIELQVKEIQAMLAVAESSTRKLTRELADAEKLVNERTAQAAATREELDRCTAQLEAARSSVADKDTKIKEMEDVIRQGQVYSGTLQTYNTSLQNDLKEEKAKRDEATRERDALQGKVAELSGQVKSLEYSLTHNKEQVSKLSEERDVLGREVAQLRTDLEATRVERNRLLEEHARATQEVERIRSMGGKSLETLETLTNEKATLEVQVTTQQRLLSEMRQELALAKEQRAAAESTSTTQTVQVADLLAQVTALQQSLSDAEARVLQGEAIRRKLHNVIQELKGNIRVFCRVRPPSSAECGSSDHDSALAFDFPPSNDILSAGIVLQAPGRGADTASSRHNFTFDKVFAPDSSQELVFEEISELVQSALDGSKVCIFAYGQTGSGKTYTMLGSEEQPGMIPRAMRQIFETSCKLGTQGWRFTMQASMLEIYNEEYRDLLCKQPARPAKEQPVGMGSSSSSAAAAAAKKHNVVHNADGSTTVTDLTSVDVSSTEKVEALLSQAMERRSVSATQLNDQSSRSHMVFTLRIDGTNSATGQSIAGVLNLVDLAGSERVKESGATGQQLKEAQNINKSLSALGDVIAAIANKEKHVPFRNSKLTYLLQNCLGGDSKTLMFVNVAPTREFAGESLCSLRFAAKVNACEINHGPPAATAGRK